jgi:hypothetical protein
LKVLVSKRSLVHLASAIVIAQIAYSGLASWMVPFLTRSYGVSLPAAGALIGVTFGAAAVAGTILGSTIISRSARNDIGRIAFAGAGLTAIGACFMLGMTAAPSPRMAVSLMMCWAFLSPALLGPVVGTAQSLVPSQMRGLTGAWLVLLMNVVSAGAGALLVGVISDRFKALGAHHPLSGALAIVSLFEWWSVLHYLAAVPHLRNELPIADDA